MTTSTAFSIDGLPLFLYKPPVGQPFQHLTTALDLDGRVKLVWIVPPSKREQRLCEQIAKLQEANAQLMKQLQLAHLAQRDSSPLSPVQQVLGEKQADQMGSKVNQVKKRKFHSIIPFNPTQQVLEEKQACQMGSKVNQVKKQKYYRVIK